MKLYYSPGACSLAVHIALREAGRDFDLARVDLSTHRLADGSDYRAISPRGYVPLLELDDGSRHTEANALLQYVADSAGQLPAPGSRERLEVTGWLAFVSTELHKTLGWLWRPDLPEAMRGIVLEVLGRRLKELDARLGQQEWLTGGFSVADAYCFTVLGWTKVLSVDLSPYPHVQKYLGRVAARPAVVAALKAEGLA